MQEIKHYKILIIDDEPRTRRRLSAIISQSNLPIELAGVFSNGIEGLEQAEILQPDIIITDIRMPKMDGIQFATKIKELIPTCQLIFISAYSDKEYLKAAISLKAIRYVEKPFSPEDILEAIQTTLTAVQEHYQRLQILEQNHQLKSEQQKLFQEQAAFRLLTPLQEEAFSEKLQLLCPEFANGSHYCTLICQLSDLEIRSYSTAKIKALIHTHFPVSLYAQKEEHIFILQISAPAFRIKPLVDHFFSDLKELLAEKSEAFIAVGKPVSAFSQLYCSYIDAVVCLKKRFFIGVDGLCFFEEADARLSNTFSLRDGFLIEFEQLLRKDALRDADAMLTRLYHQMCDPVQRFEINSIKNVYHQLLSALHHVCAERNVTGIFPDEADFIWESIAKMDTIFTLQQYLKSKLALYHEETIQKSASSRIVLRIMQYLEKHYTEPELSIRQMAEELHYTTTYLCQVFKNETGNTINNHLVTIRIRKATELLKQPDIKLYEISALVGYNDQNYFSRQFKKKMGTSPSEFREKYFL